MEELMFGQRRKRSTETTTERTRERLVLPRNGNFCRPAKPSRYFAISLFRSFTVPNGHSARSPIISALFHQIALKFRIFHIFRFCHFTPTSVHHPISCTILRVCIHS